MERVSKAILGLEALVLTYPTFLGLLLATGAITPFATGSITTEHALDAATGVFILLGLAAGWYLLLKFFLKGRALTRKATKWWLIAASAAVASITLLHLPALAVAVAETDLPTGAAQEVAFAEHAAIEVAAEIDQRFFATDQ